MTINADSPATISAFPLPASVRGLPVDHTATIAASQIAQRHLGRPLPNAALLGALVALTGVVGMPALCAAIREKFPGEAGEMNTAAAEESFAELRQRASSAGDTVARRVCGVREVIDGLEVRLDPKNRRPDADL